MQAQVGRSADGQDSDPGRYRRYRIGTKELPNGHIEEEYHFYRPYEGQLCLVFFEIDKENRKIVGWRYEGPEQACAQPS